LYNFHLDRHEKDLNLKILGIDHGNVRIGFAISDESGSFARPLSIITHVSRLKDAEEVCRLAEAEGCSKIVVGVPYDSDGREGPRARSVMRFVEQLRAICCMPVITWDESYSTQNVISTSLQMNKSRYSRRTAIDDKAAAMILQNYLDQHLEYPEDECDEKA
jgi:conserved hypothetical protein TIGR00250